MSIFNDVFGDSGFDATKVEDSDFEVLTPGEYPVIIDSASIEKTKTNKGTKLAISQTIIDGPGKGRKLFNNLCIQHENPKTESIARSKLAKLCKICGIETIQSEQELVGKVAVAEVIVEGEYNKIKGYSSYDSTNTQETKQPKESHSTSTTVPPWKR